MNFQIDILERLSPEMVHDLSRIFPYPDTWISARPVDAFISDYPEIFIFRINEGWHQLVVYNPDDQNPAIKIINFQSTGYYGAVDLKPDKNYLSWEFWDNKMAGKFRGSDSLRLHLRPGEAKMISIREKLDHPQLISTDRHLMQGLIETRHITWDPEKLMLTGQANLVAGEEMCLIFANNDYVLKQADVPEGVASFSADNQDQPDQVKVTSGLAGWKSFTLRYEKK